MITFNSLKDKVTIKYQGHSVDCFGTLKDDSNIIIDDDEILSNGSGYITGQPFKNWTEVVIHLIHLECDIEQLEAD